MEAVAAGGTVPYGGYEACDQGDKRKGISDELL
jgi:hypothetical protein